MRPISGVLLAMCIASIVGCAGGKHPVRGTVTLESGTPLTKGLVVFERVEGGAAITARGDIQSDGRYELSTDKPGDGVPPGKYKVLINPLDLSDIPDEQKQLPFDVKYMKFETSGLECEVKAGGTDYPIRLTAPPAKSPRR